LPSDDRKGQFRGGQRLEMNNHTVTPKEIVSEMKKNLEWRLPFGFISTPERIEWLSSIAKIGFFFAVWYIFSSLTNNLNGAILQKFPFALTLTQTQFLFTALYCFTLTRVVNDFPTEKFSYSLLKKVFPLSVGHILAHILTQISLEYVPVSFTHTVKALSPLFTIIIARHFTGEQFTLPIVLSTLPIVVGVSLSSMTEVNYNLTGFLAAVASTAIFAGQNIYSKVLFQGHHIDHVNLLLWTSTLAFFLLLPGWILWESVDLFAEITRDFTYGYLILANGFCHFMQSLVAFRVLSLVSPLTYSIANTCKRIFVIVSSIIYFGNKITPMNAVGITLALGGVFLYNKVQYDEQKKRKK
jgi:solute carrier family 35 protein E1